MIKLRFNKPHSVPPIGLLEGVQVLEDCNMGQMIQTADAEVICAHCGESAHIPKKAPVLTPGSEICISRPGGYGDLLFLRPILKKLVEMEVRPVICCAEVFRRPVDDYPWLPYPSPWEEFSKYDNHVVLEDMVETNPAGKTTHVIDLFAEACGVTLTDKEKRVEFSTTPAEKEWAHEHFPKTERKRIGIQLKASSPVRTYPAAMLVEVLRLLEKDGWEVLCLGRKNDANVEETELIKWVGKHDPDFGQSCSALETCDVVLAPDSALCHVGGALNIPTLALYGPFPWQLRTKYAPSIRAINGQARCAPCFHHSRGSPFPIDGPCMRSGRCEAMAEIKPERILSEVGKLWKLHGRHEFS